jgi:hypothetical protein
MLLVVTTLYGVCRSTLSSSPLINQRCVVGNSDSVVKYSLCANKVTVVLKRISIYVFIYVYHSRHSMVHILQNGLTFHTRHGRVQGSLHCCAYSSVRTAVFMRVYSDVTMHRLVTSVGT